MAAALFCDPVLTGTFHVVHTQYLVSQATSQKELCFKTFGLSPPAGFNAQYLLHYEQCLRSRIARTEQVAAHFVGITVNLSSAAQVSVALYSTLGLPPPQSRSDRCFMRRHACHE